MGVSRVTVFNRIKKGQIVAQRVGHSYVVSKTEIEGLEKNGYLQDKVVKRVIEEYGETLKLLGKE